MMRPSPPTSTVNIRTLQYRDLEVFDRISRSVMEEIPSAASMVREHNIDVSRWYGLLKFLRWFPNPLRHSLSIQIAEAASKVCGVIQTSPFNSAGTTWRVDRLAAESVVVTADEDKTTTLVTAMDLGSLLLRNSFETILQARTWILELDVSDETRLPLYRHNGFQPVAQMTYWSIAPEQLQEIAQREPDLPNLLPVSNADAHLLYQLDNMAMPPLVRQVFDRHPQDFKVSLFGSVVQLVKQWMTQTEVVSGYVFEPQRKVAIAHFQVTLSRDGSQSHSAQLAVHPAYTWLYPEVMAQVARITSEFPSQSLQILSADYHPEREAYLERVGAKRIAHTLMMSRSVWHKLRETRSMPSLEGIPLGDVIPGFQPSRKPVPGRIVLDPQSAKFRIRQPRKNSLNSSTNRETSSNNDQLFPPQDPDPCC
jgi:hypothetical protein